MSASTEYDAPQRSGEIICLGVASAVVIYCGTLVAVNANGYAVPASDAENLIVIGRAEDTVDNTDGIAGVATIKIRRGIFRFTNSETDPVTIASIGHYCFVEDDTFVTIEGGTDNGIRAGVVIGIENDWVWIDTRSNITPYLSNGAISIEHLDMGILPSHIVKLAGILTIGGGSATEAEVVAGALETDMILATIVDNAANEDVQLLEAKLSADAITFLFNEDPGADVKVAYAIFRAIA